MKENRILDIDDKWKEIRVPNFDKKLKPTKEQLKILDNVKNSETILKFLFLKTKEDTDTRRNYAGYIRDYFVKLKIEDVENYFKNPRVMKKTKGIKYKDSIERDVQKFNKLLQDYSGSNRRAILCALKKLLDYKKIELGLSFWEDVKKLGSGVFRRTDTDTPNKKELKSILKRADVEGKALFLTQMTSDSRIDSIRKLTFDNLHLETDPPTIKIPPEDEKNGKPITKFITPEAKYWIEEYLKDRDKILKTRINRARTKKVKEEYENMVFPMGKSNPNIKWKNLIIKEYGEYKIDNNTSKPLMGTHCLRRYFEDNIGNNKLAKYMANKVSKSTEPYQYKTKHKLDEEYKKYMHNLYVFEETIDKKPEFKKAIIKLGEYEKIVKEQEKIIKRYQDREELIVKNTKAKEDNVNQLSNDFRELKDNAVTIDDMAGFLGLILKKSGKKLPDLDDEEAIQEIDNKIRLMRKYREEHPELKRKRKEINKEL